MAQLEQTQHKTVRASSLDKSVDKSFDRLGKRVEATQKPRNDLDEKLKLSIGKMVRIPLEIIQLEDNVRNNIDTESDNFRALLSSIRKHGIQQNVVVELKELDGKIRLVCISGHRRITAANMIDSITHVPALIQKYEKESHKLELALAENMLREDLHCLDIANVFAKLLNHGLTREEIAKHLGKSEKTVRYYLKMSQWPASVQKFIMDNEKKFPARILMNKFACKKFISEKDLLTSLREFISTTPKETRKTTSKSKTLSLDLNSFIAQKGYSDEIKQAILEAFEHFRII